MSDQTQANGPRFPSRIEIRTTDELRGLLDSAATKEHTTTSAYARRALLNQLRADGIDPNHTAPGGGRYGAAVNLRNLGGELSAGLGYPPSNRDLSAQAKFRKEF